ncbi:signal peptidase I [Patescibacteria group bacterium]|nr:signal peptidase I [Patescibacteria group bacterium]
MRKFVLIVLFLVALQFILSYVFTVHNVNDNSMYPYLEPTQKALFVRFPLFNNILHRGDIVLYQTSNSDEQKIGRIIGLPGESVRVENGHVFINNGQIFQLYESYLAEGAQTTTQNAQFWQDLGTSQYMIFVDNRGTPIDLSSSVVDKEYIKDVLITRF